MWNVFLKFTKSLTDAEYKFEDLRRLIGDVDLSGMRKTSLNLLAD